MIVGLGNDHIMKESVYEVETYFRDSGPRTREP